MKGEFISGREKKLTGAKEIYIEDYVLFYLKEMKQRALDKPVFLALFGHIAKRENTALIYVYGAARINREKAETEEDVREKFFQDYDLIGQVKVNGNGKPNTNYHIFYEANESMQDFLLSCHNEAERGLEEKDSAIPAGLMGYGGMKASSNIWKRIKVFLMGALCVLLAIIVNTINSFDQMNQFVKVFEKVIMFME